MAQLTRNLLSVTALGLALAAQPAAAQIVGTAGDPPPGTVFDAPMGADAPSDDGEQRSSPRSERARVDVSPYLEVGQVLSAELTGNGDVFTYSTVAVGADASIATRDTQLGASVRYERRIRWDDDIGDENVWSGLIRGRHDIAQGFALEGGALATRTSIDGRGGGGLFVGGRDNTADLFSVYVGPTFGRRYGDLEVGAAYRLGYSRAEVRQDVVLPTGARRLGTFGESTNHALIASVGMRPDTLLPVGWRISGGLEREDSDPLDTRYRGEHVRLDLTYPVTPTVALVGGVGYENITLSQRPPVLDANGVPVLDARGRYVTDQSQPRQIAFDTDGLIWDAGVLWRPSRRMSLEARVGRRYGDTTFTGSWQWQPNENSAWGLSVYDRFSTVGRQLSNALAVLPTEFDIYRNPIDGSFNGCLFGGVNSSCLANTAGNLSGFGFRNRGALFSVSTREGPWSYAAAVGYDNRRYELQQIAAFADLNGVTDESWYAFISASRPLDSRTSFAASMYGNWFDSGLAGDFDSFAMGGTAAVSRSFAQRLTGTAAVAVNAIDQDGFNTRVFGSALLGLRYGF